jgi:hypothetical protein
MAQDAFETETLARLYLDQGQPEKALPILRRLHQEDPLKVSVASALAKCEELVAHRSAGSPMKQEKRLESLKRMLAALNNEIPVGPQRRLSSDRADVQPPALSPRERRLAMLRTLLNRLSAREA